MLQVHNSSLGQFSRQPWLRKMVGYKKKKNCAFIYFIFNGKMKFLCYLVIHCVEGKMYFFFFNESIDTHWIKKFKNQFLKNVDMDHFPLSHWTPLDKISCILQSRFLNKLFSSFILIVSFCK